jgi:hypothetical protein
MFEYFEFLYSLGFELMNLVIMPHMHNFYVSMRIVFICLPPMHYLRVNANNCEQNNLTFQYMFQNKED